MEEKSDTKNGKSSPTITAVLEAGYGWNFNDFLDQILLLCFEGFFSAFNKTHLKQCKIFLFYHHSRQSWPADWIFRIFLNKPDTL